MQKITGNTIYLTRGDSFYCGVYITYNDEPYTPQERDVIAFRLKHKKLNSARTDYTDPEPLVTKVIPNDTLVLHLVPEDTEPLEFGVYVYNVDITIAETGDKYTFIKDDFEVGDKA